MKIAIFSDVHANLPALESVFRDMETKQPDAIYCLGDLVGYNIWANEIIDEVKKRRIPTIAGNYDDGVGRNSDNCGCAYKTEIEKSMGAQSIAFTNEIINEDNRTYLRTLPAHIRLEFQFNAEHFKILMVHGSPRKINEYLFEDRAEKSMLRIMEHADADLLFFGHTHKPYHRILQYEIEGKKAYRHAINTGSVGKPKDGDPRACYVMLELNERTDKFHHESIAIEFIRVDYDIEKAALAVEESKLPNAFADMLRNGG